MTKPNFFVVGAMRAGTTSLFNYLSSHPEIYMPERKEPNFFVFAKEKSQFFTPIPIPRLGKRDYQTSMSAYLKLFHTNGTFKGIGEGSTNYLCHPAALNKIRRFNTDAKIIAVLRNPIERSYSAYNYQRMWGLEPIKTFEQAIIAEPDRIKKNIYYPYRYIEGGMYSDQVKRLFKEFPKNQVAIYFFDDLKSNPACVCKDLFNFLEVDPSFKPDFKKIFNATAGSSKALRLFRRRLEGNGFFMHLFVYTVRKLINNKLRDKYLKYIQLLLSNKSKKPSPISENTQSLLHKIYSHDIKKTSDLLNRDLSDWLC